MSRTQTRGNLGWNDTRHIAGIHNQSDTTILWGVKTSQFCMKKKQVIELTENAEGAHGEGDTVAGGVVVDHRAVRVHLAGAWLVGAEIIRTSSATSKSSQWSSLSSWHMLGWGQTSTWSSYVPFISSLWLLLGRRAQKLTERVLREGPLKTLFV